MGLVYEKNINIDEAVDSYIKAVEINQKYDDAYNALARCIMSC